MSFCCFRVWNPEKHSRVRVLHKRVSHFVLTGCFVLFFWSYGFCFVTSPLWTCEVLANKMAHTLSLEDLWRQSQSVFKEIFASIVLLLPQHTIWSCWVSCSRLLQAMNFFSTNFDFIMKYNNSTWRNKKKKVLGVREGEQLESALMVR